MLAAVVLGAVVALSTAPTGVAAPPYSSDLDDRFTATHNAAPQYPNVFTEWDVPITMSDGTVLKANVYHPADASGQQIAEPTPTIVNLTPYTKLVTNIIDSTLAVPGLSDLLSPAFANLDFSGFGFSTISDLFKLLPGGGARVTSVDRNLIRAGYTQVVVDVRGTGFSQGEWQVFGELEHRDGNEVVDWAARQPWSTGDIGMSGVSYSGTNQLRVAEYQNPALKAIFPVVPASDVLRDIAAPGGSIRAGFLPIWLTLVDTTKLLPDLVSILSGRLDMTWLADRVRDPFTFFNILIAALSTATVDDVPPELTALLDDKSDRRSEWIGHPARVKTPTFVYDGWHDLLINSAAKVYNSIDVPGEQKKLVLDDIYHMTLGAKMGQPGGPASLETLQRAWFDKWLKGIDNGVDGYAPVTLWQQGTERWTSDSAFPRPNVDYRRLYLTGDSSGSAPDSRFDGTLAVAPPSHQRRATVAPDLVTLCSNDTVMSSGALIPLPDVCSEDARISEAAALSFTTAPVTELTEVSGPIGVHLNTVLDATDGYWTVTINDVAPDGKSTVWSTGQLVASLRAVDDARSSRSANGDYTAPFQFLTLDTRQPVVPGEPTTLDIAIHPTDGALQPGHRLRLDIFASNGTNIPLRPLLNESGLRPQHLELDPQRPSWINVAMNTPSR
ncbi:CocE/NonD family hydrolase [Nocardia fluminea]|uniref:CocE/NonD family hydrolase n=1 Tax=Nocardia fluminea TaxID=134984 RepID=UPI00381C2F58